MKTQNAFTDINKIYLFLKVRKIFNKKLALLYLFTFR